VGPDWMFSKINVPFELAAGAGSSRRLSACEIEHRDLTGRPACSYSLRAPGGKRRSSSALSQVRSGQGRDRTAGLPLFRNRVHRPRSATHVVSRAQRHSMVFDRPSCTEVNETRNETRRTAHWTGRTARIGQRRCIPAYCKISVRMPSTAAKPDPSAEGAVPPYPRTRCGAARRGGDTQRAFLRRAHPAPAALGRRCSTLLRHQRHQSSTVWAAT
jgi:hypothetical protein